MDTIFALSSGSPPAAIAVVRLSGPAALSAAERLAGPLPPPRQAALRSLRDEARQLIDRALVLVFPGPASATGEDLVELHLHGGRAVVAVVEAMLEKLGLRRAVAGEFTRRALTHGRIDLAEAEGLADLLAAETEAERRAAMGAVGGRLSTLVERWRGAVTSAAAGIEASLDFSDEGDVDASPDNIMRASLGRLAEEMAALVSAPTVERIRAGLTVVLAGPPNAGKSTLLNALSGREAAIVTPIAGTTRDLIEVPVMRGGVGYVLVDTAGLVDVTSDPVERIGIERASRAAKTADVVLWLGDGPSPFHDAVLLHARADLPERADPPANRIAVSAATNNGIAELWAVIAAWGAALLPRPDALIVNHRQREQVVTAEAAIRAAASAADPLIMAEELRRARASLGRVTGHEAVEELLDALFSRFCIGK